MNCVTMVGWSKGLKVVSLIEAVNRLSSLSLIQAKAEVERLLGGEPVTLLFEVESSKTEFLRIATILGVVCREHDMSDE